MTLPLLRFVSLAVFLLVLGCKGRRLEVREASVDFGAFEISQAVDVFKKSGKSTQSYSEFSKKIEMLKPQLNLETTKSANYWSAVLLHPLMASSVELSFKEQADDFALLIWSAVLKIPPKETDSTNQYLQSLCSEQFAHSCMHLVPEAWPSVVSNVVWQTYAENLKNVIQECLDCDGSRNIENIHSKVKVSAENIAKRSEHALEEGSPYLWPIAYAGLDNLDENLEKFVCKEDGSCQEEENKISQKSNSKRLSKMGLALRLSPNTTINVTKDILKKFDRRFGTNVDKFLIFRDKEFPYPEKQLKLASTQELTKNMRIEGGDSLQLWIQAKAAQN